MWFGVFCRFGERDCFYYTPDWYFYQCHLVIPVEAGIQVPRIMFFSVARRLCAGIFLPVVAHPRVTFHASRVQHPRSFLEHIRQENV